MKKLLLVMVLMVIGVIVYAEGTTFSWKGEFRTRTEMYKAPVVDGDISQFVDSRLRFYMNAKMSDSLSFTYGLEIGDLKWGELGKGMPRDGINVETKHLYLDFKPDAMDSLAIRFGLLPVKDSFGGAMFDEDAVGLLITPKMENVKLTFGYVYLNDRMGNLNGASVSTTATTQIKLIPVVNSAWSDLHYGMFDMNYTMSTSMNLMFGAYYMNGKATNLKIITPYVDTDEHLELTKNTANANSLWLAAGMSDKLSDTTTVGAQFIYLTEGIGRTDLLVESIEEDPTSNAVEADLTYDPYHTFSYFAYAYGTYKASDKTNFKLNFGYIPGFDGQDMIAFHGIDNKEYWSNFGLEYAFNGEVFDTNTGRLGYFADGIMVISANANLGMVYINAGYMSATASYLSDLDISKYLGLEFDLGMKYDITKGLKLQAVGAIFLPGSYYEDKGNDTEIGYEFASCFKYAF